MTSIIKQINYDEFTKIVGQNQFEKFVNLYSVHSSQKVAQLQSENADKKESLKPEQEPLACVFFITDWSVPSRSIVKRIKKHPINKQYIGIIDVDLVDNIELTERFQVKSVPYCILFKKSNAKILDEFAGLNSNKLNQTLDTVEKNNYQYYEVKKKKVTKKSPPKRKTCLKDHKIQYLNKLDQSIYADQFFYCNMCKRVESVSNEKPVGHCQICDFDICVRCSKKV